MKAVVFAGTRTVEVREVPDAVLEEPTDVVLRVTSSAICGTDLHMYDGRTGAEPGLVFGHDPLGVVEQAGFRPVSPYTADGHLTVPWATFFSKGVSVGFGRTHDRRYTVLLRDMVLSGRARPAPIVTHHGTLDDAPALYQAFDQRAEGVIKAVLRP
jgi:threonine dehydrogenase-like Zn-dependent dehydrogenase